MKKIGRYICYISMVLLVSCERDFDIKANPGQTQLVVEAYISNLGPQYNYVLLTRSYDYFAADTQSLFVANAKVTITEGSPGQNNAITWDTANRVQLTDATLGGLPENYVPGIYFDRRLITDFTKSLIGIPGKYYLLEIASEGNHYSASTAMPYAIPIDSVTPGFYFKDTEDSNKLKARITIHYKDPDTLGNAQLFFRRTSENRLSFGWGGLSSTRRINGPDDNINGQYVHLTAQQNYKMGDTVTVHMASVSREVYNFWDSFNKARNNNGPFATPVALASNIQGNNVTGCFSGFSTSSKTIIVR